MTLPRWEDAEAAFDRLAPLTGAARADALAELRTRDPELHHLVGTLLSAHDSDGPLDRLSRLLGGARADAAAPAAEPGAQVGRFVVGELAGQGGMGEVYRARDLRLDREVALKFLPAWLGRDAAARERFMAEARTVSALDHPNICTLFEVGETDDGRLFLVMPHYTGETLRARLQRGPLAPSDRHEVMRQLCLGIAAAHDRGIVHRDLTPANILLTRDGLVKILDFGIATLAAEPGGAAERAGTPHYMAPEQQSGGPVDARTDLWALGIILHEMATGRRPAEGVITPSARRRMRPVEAAAVARLLQADRAARPASARDVAAHLVRAHEARRGRRARWMAAVALLLLVAVSVAAMMRARSAHAAFGGFGRATRVAWQQGVVAQPAISPDGAHVAYVAGNQGHTRIMRRPLGGGSAVPVTPGLPGAESSPSWSPDGSRLLFLRDSVAYSVPASGGAPRLEVPAQGPSAVTSAAWSPDGTRIAFTAADSLLVRDATGTVRWLASASRANSCRWSPDGRRIACAVGNHWYAEIGALFGNLAPSAIAVYDVATGAERRLTDTLSLNQAPAWTADGEAIVFISNRHGPLDLYQVAAEGGTPRRLTTGLGAQWFALSADDGQLVYSVLQDRGNIWRLPVGEDLATAEQVTHAATSIETFDVSPDGRWLVYSADIAGNGDLFRHSLADGEVTRLTTDSAGDYSPDILLGAQSLVVFQSWRAGTRDLYVMTLDGDSVRLLAGSPRQEVMPRWSPDGRSIAFSHFEDESDVMLLQRDDAGAWRTPRRLARGHLPTWSPDGLLLAYLTDMPRGTPRLMEVDRGVARDLLGAGSPLRLTGEFVEFSANGAFVRLLSRDARGVASIWEVPVLGGEPRELLRFDDPTRPVVRPYFTMQGAALYFIVQEQQGALWAMDVQRD